MAKEEGKHIITFIDNLNNISKYSISSKYISKLNRNMFHIFVTWKAGPAWKQVVIYSKLLESC